MERKTFTVPKISCGHCVHDHHARSSRGSAACTASRATPSSRPSRCEWEAPATEAEIRATLTEINFPAAA